MHGEDDSFERPLGFEEPPAHFESATQIARVLTEQWALRWMFCPACGARQFSRFPNNSPVADLRCGACREEFELKSTKSRFGRKVVDGAYGSMRERLASSNNPNFVLLRYENLESGASRNATDLMVIPKHFFTPGVIEARPPLSPSARRAGWVG